MFLLSDFPFPCYYCEEQLQLPLLLEKHIDQNHPNKQDQFVESNVDERYEYELKGLIENLGRQYDLLLLYPKHRFIQKNGVIKASKCSMSVCKPLHLLGSSPFNFPKSMSWYFNCVSSSNRK